MKNYVKISSTINVCVTSGLQYKDFTNHESDIANRLKINATWPKTTIDVKEGVHWYPSEITEWNTVKALVKDKILTIGEFSDSTEEDEAIKMKQKVSTLVTETKKTVKQQMENVTLNKLTEVK